MPDGMVVQGWPLLLGEKAAARLCSMTLRDFRIAVEIGLLPAGRTPEALCRAGLIPPDRAARLATIGAIWHRAEIEARAAALFGLEGQAAIGQAQRKQAVMDALDAFRPPTPAVRQGRSQGR